MKPGFTTFTCPDWTLAQMLAQGVRLGYQGVCFRCSAGHGHGVETVLLPGERKTARRLLLEHRMEACCLVTPLRISQVSDLHRVESFVALAAELGCPGIVVYPGLVPDYADVAELVRQVGAHLRGLEHLLADYHVQVWLATHEGLSHVTDAAAAVRLAEHDLVGLSWDVAQSIRKGEPLTQTARVLRANPGLLRQVILYDAMDLPDHCVVQPLGQGQMPLAAVSSLLTELRYAHYVCGHWTVDRQDKPADLMQQYLETLAGLVELEQTDLLAG